MVLPPLSVERPRPVVAPLSGLVGQAAHCLHQLGSEQSSAPCSELLVYGSRQGAERSG